MALELTGKIKVIKDTVSVGASGFQKREFVIETEDKYPQSVPFEFVKDKVGILDSYRVGQAVKVEFNVRGNEYNGKYYVSLQAWKIAADGATSSPAPSRPAASAGRPAAGRPATRPAAAPVADEDAPW